MLFSENLGTKLGCYRAERFMLSRRYSYEIGSKEEGLAGSVLQAYYAATHEPTIKLSDPRQVRLLDALTEAAGIPHQRGQAEVEIPEKLRSYTKYQMSEEYQQKWAQAQAKRLK